MQLKFYRCRNLDNAIENFENVYSWRCNFLDFGGKIKSIQDRLFSGNK